MELIPSDILLLELFTIPFGYILKLCTIEFFLVYLQVGSYVNDTQLPAIECETVTLSYFV